MDRYRTKQRLLRPLTALRRRRAGDLNPYTRALYEAHGYRPSMRHFVEATRRDPDLLVDVDLPHDAVVLDVGAYVGEWSERILRRADERGVRGLQIHAFEPEPVVFERLQQGVGRDARVRLHPIGLAGRDRSEQLALGGPGSSVFLDGATPGFMGERGIELRDVDAVLRSLGVDRIDVVKINIEGGEFELLDRLHATGWMGRMGPLIVQFHEFGPDAHAGRRRNRRQLGETHRCTWDHPWVYERWDPR